jgi:hypothetical protein
MDLPTFRPREYVRERTGQRPRSPLTGLLGEHSNPTQGVKMLLILAAILLIIAIAGGVIIHPLLFLLAIVAIVVFFAGRRGAAVR